MSQDLCVIIKPDGVRRGLIGNIISRFENKGFTISKMRFVSPTKEILRKHYSEHSEKVFFGAMIEFMTSGPVVVMVMNGDIKVARSIVGATVPWDASPGTIRGDYANTVRENLVHCSDTSENARREIKLWFS